MNAYINAYISLQKESANGALISARENCFLCDTNKSGRPSIVGIVWRETESEQKASALAAMRQWHRVTFPDLALSSRDLADEDRLVWRASTRLLS